MELLQAIVGDERLMRAVCDARAGLRIEDH